MTQLEGEGETEGNRDPADIQHILQISLFILKYLLPFTSFTFQMANRCESFVLKP